MPHPIRRSCALILLALLVAAPAPADRAAPRAKGSLVIVGGGSRDEALMRRFVELAGGPGRARIAVVPMASEEAEASGAAVVQELDSLGANAFVFLVTRDQADTPAEAHR